MKKYFIYFSLICYSIVRAQNINITLSPVISSTSYQNVSFNKLLNLGAKNINTITLKPTLYFNAFDIKPGIKIKLNYDKFILYGSFYISNSLTGPIPIAQQYNANGTPSYDYLLGANHKKISINPIKKELTENESSYGLGYRIFNNITASVIFSNYNINIDKAHVYLSTHIDTTKLNFTEKINSIGLNIEYKTKIYKTLLIALSSSYSSIYNFNLIYFDNGYFKHNYKGYNFHIGMKLKWKSIFFSYKYLQINGEKNYFKNISHKFEIGISIESLSIDPEKLFGE